MVQSDCTVAERLAGAIAIGEAGDQERVAYRAHLAGCPRCVHALGGEREIERVMSAVAHARDDERWEPVRLATLATRRMRHNTWTLATALAAAVVLAIGLPAEKPRLSAPPEQAVSSRDPGAIAALNTQTVPRREGRAESLSVDAATTFSTAFDVAVDQRGTPRRCTITKSSGFRVVDRSVCRAAMHAHYSPPMRR